MAPTSVSLNLASTHVLTTGGAGLVGTPIVTAGSHVTILDISRPRLHALEQAIVADMDAGLYPPEHTPAHLRCVVADIRDEESLSSAWAKAETVFGPAACCVALAGLDLSVLEHCEGGVAEMEVGKSERVMRVNVRGTFLTAREWVRGLRRYQDGQGTRSAGRVSAAEGAGKGALPNRSLILVGGEYGLLGERRNPDYAAGKSAVQGRLLASLKADVPRTLGEGARVNAVAPGPVDTEQYRREVPGGWRPVSRGCACYGCAWEAGGCWLGGEECGVFGE